MLLRAMFSFSHSFLRSDAMESSPSVDFGQLLFTQRRYQCSDPRDRVFSLLSMLSADDQRTVGSPLNGGYRMAVRDVWCVGLKVAIWKTSQLGELGHEPEDENANTHNLPSWMSSLERYDRDLAKDHAGLRDTANGRLCFLSQAGGQGMPDALRNDLLTCAPTVLLLSGHSYSTVECCRGVIDPSMIEWTKGLLTLIRLVVSWIPLGMEKQNSSPFEELIIRLMSADKSIANEDEVIWYIKALEDLEWCAENDAEEFLENGRPDLYLEPDSVAGSDSREDRMARVKALKRLVLQVLMDRRVFSTEASGFCIGPRTTEPGDQLVLLHGAKWPVVLRRVEDSWRWIGFAYVYGVMQGEAWREFQEAGRECETFAVT